MEINEAESLEIAINEGILFLLQPNDHSNEAYTDSKRDHILIYGYTAKKGYVPSSEVWHVRIMWHKM